MKIFPQIAVILLSALFVTGCATSSFHVVGQVRPPLNPAQVRIYRSAPPRFLTIATIGASSRARFFFGSRSTDDESIENLKIEAAKVGANGILLTAIGDEPSGGIGLGVGGGGYASRNSAVSGEASGTVPLVKTVAHGLAIYVADQR